MNRMSQSIYLTKAIAFTGILCIGLSLLCMTYCWNSLYNIQNFKFTYTQPNYDLVNQFSYLPVYKNIRLTQTGFCINNYVCYDLEISPLMEICVTPINWCYFNGRSNSAKDIPTLVNLSKYLLQDQGNLLNFSYMSIWSKMYLIIGSIISVLDFCYVLLLPYMYYHYVYYPVNTYTKKKKHIISSPVEMSLISKSLNNIDSSSDNELKEWVI